MNVAYYNEHDPRAAEWLRELIKAGLIAPGDVDTRDVQDVKPHELTGYTQQHFFAGIGGWSFALRLAGWPDDRPVRTGSCPCQPFSAAGKGLGEADERHLWPVFRDLIAFGEPTITFGEQVASAAGRLWLSRVRADLEGLGYAVGASDLCSAGVGSPNIRQRLFWMAYAGHTQPRSTGPRQTQGWRSLGHAPGRGDACGLAYRNSQRFSRREEQDKRQIKPEFDPSRWDDPVRCGKPCGLEYSEGERRDAGGDIDNAPIGTKIGARTGGVACGLGNANNEGQQGWDERGDGGDKWSPWAASVAIPCTDGKARRIEPGSCPLAHGVPGRVGLLRGYGNAINPWLAAEFIQACQESIE